MYGYLEIFVVSCPLDKKVIWLVVRGLTLNLMSWACKGYTSTSEIEIFNSDAKQKVFNDEKCQKHQSLIPIYTTF